MGFSEGLRIFKNEDILSTDYLPDILPHRENQIKQLAYLLETAERGGKSQNIFIFGSPGIGKTVSVKFVFREFENYSGVKTIYINCWDYNTSTSILSEIVSGMGMFVQRRGWAKDEIMSRLLESLNKSKKALMICLDEVDQLIFKDQKILYDLVNLNERVKNPVGLIFISNNKHVFAGMEPRIYSRLGLDEIEFKPYTLQEMKDILQERVNYGFHSVEEGVVSLTAVHALHKNGDVRVGLQCLLKAGRIAEQENSDKVKVIHLKHVLKDVKDVKPQILKDNISELERKILDIINNKSNLTLDELYKEYSNQLESPLTKRMFREYVNHLDEIKLLKFSKRKLGRSRLILKV